MMRALFLRVAIGTCTAISLAASAANAQSVKPKYPGEIAAASERVAQRNEDCQASGARAAFASRKALPLHARLQAAVTRASAKLMGCRLKPAARLPRR
jgi:hypothetical protein